MEFKEVPSVTFHTRVRNDELESPNPFEWKDVRSEEIFTGRNIVLIAVPGAFTPACSNSHLPGFEENYDAFTDLGVDEILCLSVNDAFVMAQWAKALGVSRVRMLPDGNAAFSKGMGMLIRRESHGMGYRSWRYAAYIEDGQIIKLFAEPGLRDNPEGVPVEASSAQSVLRFLTSRA